MASPDAQDRHDRAAAITPNPRFPTPEAPGPVRGVDPSSYKVFLALIGLVVATGAILVYRLRRGAERDSGHVSHDELLRDLERAYYAGHMDEAEFRRVTESLEARKTGTPRPKPEPAADEPEEPPPPEESEGAA
jgi:hypothetical protein